MKVFLSYAKEDKDFVLECYEELKRKNFNPWMDEHDLLPGQAWDECIKANMQDTDVVLVFMSSDSVSKVGYVQRELKYFVDKRKDYPEGFIYLIPIQLDKCQVPNTIASEIQFININRDLQSQEWTKVLRSLDLASKQRNIERINEDSTKPRIELKEISESVTSFTGYEFNSNYPVIKAAHDNFKEVNELIYSVVIDQLIHLRQRFFEEPLEIERENNEPTFRDIYDTLINADIGYVRNNFVSFIFTNYFYTGGAHGNHHFFTRNFYVNNGKAILINYNLLFHSENILEAEAFIKSYCYEDLLAQIAYRSEFDDFDKEWVKQGSEQIDSNTILIKEYGLEIFFAPYTVTAYAFGDFKVEIPFYKLSKYLDKRPNSFYSLLTAYEYEEG